MTALTEQLIGTDRAVVVGGGLVLVSSASCPGTWHRVRDGACTCKGYEYRSSCRHLAVALEATWQAEPHCSRCGRKATRLYGTQCARCISSTPDD